MRRHKSIQWSLVWVQGSGFRVRGSGFKVQGSGFRVQGSGLNAADATGGHIWTRLVAQCTISYVQCTISYTVVQSVVKKYIRWFSQLFSSKVGVHYSGVTLNVARPDMNNYATLGVMLY